MSSNPTIARRQRWLSVLAKAPGARLTALWEGLGALPSYTVLRRPEIGLVMVQQDIRHRRALLRRRNDGNARRRASRQR